MEHVPPTLDMRLDGSFQSPPRAAGMPLSLKLMIGGGLVAMVAGSLAVAALAMWVFSMLLPLIVTAGLFGWGMLMLRRWQASRVRGSNLPYRW